MFTAFLFPELLLQHPKPIPRNFTSYTPSNHTHCCMRVSLHFLWNVMQYGSQRAETSSSFFWNTRCLHSRNRENCPLTGHLLHWKRTCASFSDYPLPNPILPGGGGIFPKLPTPGELRGAECLVGRITTLGKEQYLGQGSLVTNTSSWCRWWWGAGWWGGWKWWYTR